MSNFSNQTIRSTKEDETLGTDAIQKLNPLEDLADVNSAKIDYWHTNRGQERIAVVALEHGIQSIPPTVVRGIGHANFSIESIERYDDHIEVVCQ